jgi:hypothetical protein
MEHKIIVSGETKIDLNKCIKGDSMQKLPIQLS